MFKRFTLLLLAIALCSSTAWADISDNYSFSSSTGNSYTEITGGTLLVDGGYADDNQYEDNSIGFDFSYNGVNYSSFSVSVNGYIQLGDETENSWGPISDTDDAMIDVISPLGVDLKFFDDNANNELRYQTIGTSPDRVCVIQWKEVSEYDWSTPSNTVSFQVRLYEGSNDIEFHYGSFDINENDYCEVGLRGDDENDFFNREVTDGTNSWSSSNEGTNNDDECDLTSTTYPSSGLVYSFEPYDMELVDYNAYQIDIPVVQGKADAPVIALNIQTQYAGNAFEITELIFNTNGTTDLSDVTNAKIYYTNSNVFSTDNLIATIADPGSGDITVNPNMNLGAGDNYFWVAYDLDAASTLGNEIDAEVTSFTLGTTDYTPTTTAPTGSRVIATELAGKYTVGTGGDYETLNEAMNNLIALGATDDVEFEIISDIAETSSVDILPWNENGGDFSLTIGADANGPHMVTANSPDAGVINLVQVDDVIIDGQGNATDRNLTIKNTSDDFGIGILLYGEEDAVGCEDITIMNTNIIGNSNNIDDENVGIYFYSEHNDVTIDNNAIHTVFRGIDNDNGDADYNNLLTNLEITNNEIGSDRENEYITGGGIYIEYTEDALIDNNRVFNVMAPDDINDNAFGIGCFEDHDNLVVSNNVITGVYNRDYNGEGAFGIYLDIDDPALVVNNFISDILGENDRINDYENTAGIQVYSSMSDESKFYHNTVYMTGEQFNGDGDMSDESMVAAFCVGYSSSDDHDVRNNIFHCEVTGNSGSEIYGMYLDGDENVATCDYNNYYSSYKIAEVDGVEVNSLSDLQAETGDDDNSTNIETFFVSDTDLHLNNGSIFNDDLRVPAIADVDKDIDGEDRRDADVYMGADEIYFTLGIEDDLEDPTVPFCPGDYVEMTFVPTVSSFADGVARTFDNEADAYEYTWYKDGDEITGNYSTSNTVMGNMLVLGDYTEEDAASYYVTASRGEADVTSNTADLTIEFPIGITGEPQDVLACRDNMTIDFNVSATGTILGYQWQKQEAGSWEDMTVPSATTSRLTVDITDPDLEAETTHYYRVIVSGPGNCGPSDVYSVESELWFADPITNAVTIYSFDPRNVCFGDRIEMTADAEGTIFGYQWQKQEAGAWVDIDPRENPTADDETFVIERSILPHTGLYRALILGSMDCDEPYVPTTEVDIKVWPLFSVSSQPMGEVVCAGDEVMLDIVADGIVHEYHWYKDGEPMDAKENPSVLTPILDLGNAEPETSGLYTCIMEIEDCRGISDFESDGAVVYVLRETEITEQPKSTTANIGDDVSFRVKAHVEGSPPGYEVDVQWYRGTMELTNNERFEGTKSSILTIRDVKQSDYADNYYVIVRGLCGEAQSDMVELGEGPGIDITTQPQDIETCAGESVTFTVEATPTGSGNNLDYQWMKDGVDLVNGGDVAGADTDMLVLSNVTPAEEGDYSCEITVTPGNTTAISDAAALAVHTAPEITTQPQDVSVDAGKDFSLNIEADGYGTLTYQWYQDGTEVTGATSATLTITGAQAANSGTYTCMVTNECGSIESDAAVVTVTKSNETGVDEVVTGGFQLMSNTPNPFNDVTTIKFAVPYASHVTITLTDANGREVGTIFDTEANTGINEVDLNARDYNLSSGVYFVTMHSGGYTMTKQIVLVK
jgi:hypothetical protein